MKLNKLLKLDKVVEEILEKEELARKDDCILILCVVQELAPELAGSTFEYVMFNAKSRGISFESITRCRRKIQRKRPELADKETELARQKEQLEYMEYSNMNHIPGFENTMEYLDKLSIKGN